MVQKLISTAEAAEKYGVKPRTVRHWIATGRIAGYRVGARLIKVDVNELDRVLTPLGRAV